MVGTIILFIDIIIYSITDIQSEIILYLSILITMYIRERESGTVGMQCNKLHDDDWFIRRRPQEKKVGLTTWQCLKESTRRAVTRGSDVASMAPRLNKGSFFFF
jgi:hypothetical protein